ncbi:MAG: hypothetical protein ABI251_14060 [Mycobacteriaceae bacterium]
MSSDSTTTTMRPAKIGYLMGVAAGEDLTARDRWVGALEAIAAAQAELAQLTRQAVIAARSRGATWQQVADALDLNSEQDAEFCYGIERPLPRCGAR